MAYAFRLVSLLKCTKIYHGTFAIYEKVPQIFPFYIKSWVTSEDMSLLVQMNRTSLVVPMLLLTDRTHERERLMNFFFWIAPILSNTHVFTPEMTEMPTEQPMKVSSYEQTDS